MRLIWVLLYFGLLDIQVCAVDLFAVLLLDIDCLFTFAGVGLSVVLVILVVLLCCVFCNLCFDFVLCWG